MAYEGWQIHPRIGGARNGETSSCVMLDLSLAGQMGHTFSCDATKLLNVLPKIEEAAKKVLAASKLTGNGTHLFRKKPISESTVKARRHISGDWIVTDIDGTEWPAPDKQFRISYEPVDEAGNIVDWPE